MATLVSIVALADFKVIDDISDFVVPKCREVEFVIGGEAVPDELVECHGRANLVWKLCCAQDATENDDGYNRLHAGESHVGSSVRRRDI